MEKLNSLDENSFKYKNEADKGEVKLQTSFNVGLDVYGNPLCQWTNISHEGDQDIFAYPTPQGTIIYGLDSEGEKDFNTSFTKDAHYLEFGSDEDYGFNTLEESKIKALELIKLIKN